MDVFRYSTFSKDWRRKGEEQLDIKSVLVVLYSHICRLVVDLFLLECCGFCMFLVFCR